MNSLMGYGSDDNSDESTEEKQTITTDCRQLKRKSKSPSPAEKKAIDANYEEVQMDLSEESNESKKSDRERERKSRDRDDSSRSKHDKNRNKDKDKDKNREREKMHDRDRRDDYRSRQNRDRDRRKSHRSNSRERRRYSRSKSRSRSRDRSDRKYTNSKRYDRASNKMAQLDKMGIEIKTPDCQYVKPSDLQKSMDDEKRNGENNKDRFFVPGITGRFRDQIERRKLLWQKKEPEKKVEQPEMSSGSRSTKVWETTTFAQDNDGKVASKFKRLMGIKKNSSDGSNSATDVLKKQEEMFSSMEQQYEVARTTTHTMRGVGLGFGSYQR